MNLSLLAKARDNRNKTKRI